MYLLISLFSLARGSREEEEGLGPGLWMLAGLDDGWERRGPPSPEALGSHWTIEHSK